MRPCFFPAMSSISFVLAYHIIISFLLFTAEARPVQSAHTYSNDVGAIGNLAEDSNGEPTPTAPILLAAPQDMSSLQPSSLQPSDILSLQPSAVLGELETPVVGEGSVNQTKVNPSFDTNRCGECKVNIDLISIKKAKIELRRTRDTFLLDYTAGLKQMNCPTFESKSCTDEITAQELALQEYKQHTNKILGSLDTFDCIISLNQEQQSCPVEVFDQHTSNATDTSQDYELDALDKLAAEDIFFEETRELARVVRSAQAALDAIDELINSLFAFGGASTGGVCSIATSIAKSAFLKTKVQLLTELHGAQYILTEKEAANEAASKFLLRHNYIVTKAALGKITLVYKKVIELQKEVGHLSKLLCPFGKYGLKSKLQRQGCDGVDQNCDGRVDECAEDQVPPTIELAQPVPTTPFADIKSARDFLESNINVMDDCAAEIDTSIVLLDHPLCSSCKFSVLASDKRCDHDSAYSRQVFVLPVLSKKKGTMSIKCGFSTPKDKKNVKDGSFDSCKENIAPLAPDGDVLHIDESVLKQKVDAGLWYDIDASKKDGIIDVDIVVKSNELEGQPNDNTMASFAVRSPTSKGNAQAMVFLAPTTCQDGFSQLSPCVAEETKGVTTRIYDIEVTGTGADGATDTATCSVIVVPQNHHIPIKAIAAGTILVVGGIVAGEIVGNLASSEKSSSKKSSKKKSGGKSKKRRAVRQRGLQGEQDSGPKVTDTQEHDLWYPATNAPTVTHSPTLKVAPAGPPSTAAPISSSTLHPEVVLQKFEHDKDVLHKQYKLSKWRFEVGSVSLKFDPKFDTGIKDVQEERRRHLQDVTTDALLGYNPLC